MNTNLKNVVAEKITSNYLNVDQFYLQTAKDIIGNFVAYFDYLYENKITEKIAINELLHLFTLLNDNDYPPSYFLEVVKNHKYVSFPKSAVDCISEKSLNDSYGYISSAIISGNVDGLFAENKIKNFSSKIPNYIFRELDLYTENQNERRNSMMEINLKNFADAKKISLEELSIKTGLSVEVLRGMYYKGEFNGDEVGVHALSELLLALDILNIHDLVPKMN